MELLPHCAVKYFTADILESAAKSTDSVSSQAQYHNALEKHCGDRLDFFKGRYSIYAAMQPRIDPENPRRQPRECEKVQVWKLEEKQSDVNIALHMYDDAIRGEVDHVVLVTNDTDLVPAFEMLEARCPQIIRGLVIPTRKSEADGALTREANTSLAELAHWVRSHITDDELHQAQLPDVVPGNRRASIKPYSWYPRPDHLTRMLELARPVLGKEGKIMKWAREPNDWMGNQRPIDLLETDEGAAQVFAYIEDYIAKQAKV